MMAGTSPEWGEVAGARDTRPAILVALLTAPATNPLAASLLAGPDPFEDRLLALVDRLAARIGDAGIPRSVE